MKAANWVLLLHAYGAAFDNRHLIVTCIIGNGEAETGALATSWHSDKFLNPTRDGAVFRSCISTGSRSPIRRC
jgi:phosphoketolase